MIRLFGSICGLVVFSSTILVGLVTGAAPGVLIPRAVQGLLGGVAMGLAAGWIGVQIIQDGVRKSEASEASTHDEERHAADDHHGDVTVVGG